MQLRSGGPVGRVHRVGWLVLGLTLSLGVPPAAGEDRVEIVTGLGSIVVELAGRQAPLTVANFLRYVDDGLFDGGSFYRVVHLDNDPDKEIKIEVIQGGRSGLDESEALPPIPHETTETSGLRHVDGVISMARLEPGSATSEFFICVGDQPALDFGGQRNPDGQGFAAFGRVVRGMEVVRRIHTSPHVGQSLEPPVPIETIRRTEGGP